MDLQSARFRSLVDDIYSMRYNPSGGFDQRAVLATNLLASVGIDAYSTSLDDRRFMLNALLQLSTTFLTAEAGIILRIQGVLSLSQLAALVGKLSEYPLKSETMPGSVAQMTAILQGASLGRVTLNGGIEGNVNITDVFPSVRNHGNGATIFAGRNGGANNAAVAADVIIATVRVRHLGEILEIAAAGVVRRTPNRVAVTIDGRPVANGGISVVTAGQIITVQGAAFASASFETIYCVSNLAGSLYKMDGMDTLIGMVVLRTVHGDLDQFLTAVFQATGMPRSFDGSTARGRVLADVCFEAFTLAQCMALDTIVGNARW